VDFKDILADRLIAGLEIITPKLTAKSVDAETLNVTGDASFAGLTITSGSADLPGNIIFDSVVEFNMAPVFNKDTAGFAMIKEGDKSVRITFEKPYAMTPAVTASISFEGTDNIDESNASTLLSANVTSIIVSKDTTGFTILLNKRAPQNIRFSWIALGVKDAKTFESLGDGLQFISPEPSVEPAPAPVVTSDPAPTPTTAPDSSTDTTPTTTDPAPTTGTSTTAPSSTDTTVIPDPTTTTDTTITQPDPVSQPVADQPPAETQTP
jgi:hypothetical protein